MSLRSWGEKLTVQVIGQDGAVVVAVNSRSSLPTTLFDFGKNAENLRRFVTDPEFDSARLAANQ